MNTKRLDCLLNAKDKLHDKTSLEALSEDLKLAFLEAWSETPDNIETANFLNIAQVKNKFTRTTQQGLVLTTQNELISNILWTAFGESEVPKELLKQYPSLKKEEWNQIIRISQLVLSLFEYQEEE